MKTWVREMDIRYESREEGEIECLINLVTKKIKKEKPLEIIVDELDDNVDNIRPIYDAIIECGVDEDVSKIYEVWKSKFQNRS